MTRSEILREITARQRWQEALEKELRELVAIGADADPTATALRNNRARMEWLATKLGCQAKRRVA